MLYEDSFIKFMHMAASVRQTRMDSMNNTTPWQRNAERGKNASRQLREARSRGNVAWGQRTSKIRSNSANVTTPVSYVTV